MKDRLSYLFTQDENEAQTVNLQFGSSPGTQSPSMQYSTLTKYEIKPMYHLNRCYKKHLTKLCPFIILKRKHSKLEIENFLNLMKDDYDMGNQTFG